jgi:hypothetical protein
LLVQVDVRSFAARSKWAACQMQGCQEEMRKEEITSSALKNYVESGRDLFV